MSNPFQISVFILCSSSLVPNRSTTFIFFLNSLQTNQGSEVESASKLGSLVILQQAKIEERRMKLWKEENQ